MKNYLIIVIVLLGAGLFLALKRVDTLNKKYETATANIKAYDAELSDLKTKNTAYQLTVDQLEYFQDSVLRELNKTREELKVKDKDLKALQAVHSTFTVKDTITFTDTLFVSPSLAIDTLISDEWYSVSLGLRYPSTIAVSPSFISKKHIVVSTKKETVNPPKKWWICRIFQKKHRVLKVDVVEKNPYVECESSKYIEILK